MIESLKPPERVAMLRFGVKVVALGPSILAVSIVLFGGFVAAFISLVLGIVIASVAIGLLVGVGRIERLTRRPAERELPDGEGNAPIPVRLVDEACEAVGLSWRRAVALAGSDAATVHVTREALLVHIGALPAAVLSEDELRVLLTFVLARAWARHTVGLDDAESLADAVAVAATPGEHRRMPRGEFGFARVAGPAILWGFGAPLRRASARAAQQADAFALAVVTRCCGVDALVGVMRRIELVEDLARRFARNFLAPALHEGALPDAPLQGFREFVASRGQPVAERAMLADDVGSAWTRTILPVAADPTEQPGAELIALYRGDLARRVGLLREATRRGRDATVGPADVSLWADPTRRRSLEIRIAGGLFGDKPATEAARSEALREIAADALTEYAISELRAVAVFSWSGPVAARLPDGRVDAISWAADLIAGRDTAPILCP